jgi:hypothetical protein
LKDEFRLKGAKFRLKNGKDEIPPEGGSYSSQRI